VLFWLRLIKFEFGDGIVLKARVTTFRKKRRIGFVCMVYHDVFRCC